jgi:hypothetical protein
MYTAKGGYSNEKWRIRIFWYTLVYMAFYFILERIYVRATGNLINASGWRIFPPKPYSYKKKSFWRYFH